MVIMKLPIDSLTVYGVALHKVEHGGFRFRLPLSVAKGNRKIKTLSDSQIYVQG